MCSSYFLCGGGTYEYLNISDQIFRFLFMCLKHLTKLSVENIVGKTIYNQTGK